MNAERSGAIEMACLYLKTYAIFARCKNLPSLPFGEKTIGANRQAWISYYFDIWGLVGNQLLANIDEIRAKYSDKNVDIPTISVKK